MRKIQVLAALNKTASSGTGTISLRDTMVRTDFGTSPVTEAELKSALKGANVLEFKILVTIHGLLSQINQRPKWRTAQVVLVDAYTIDDARGLSGDLKKPVPVFDEIRTVHLAEGQPRRIIIGLIPHSKTDQSDIKYLQTAGVDVVCTVEALQLIIPTQLRLLDE